MAKYDPLRAYLEGGSLPVEMTFAEIAQLVGGLPPSAYLFPSWWSNSANHHAQARAWLDLGHRVQSLDLARQLVVFIAPLDQRLIHRPIPRHSRIRRHRVIFLPGGLLPAEPAYAGLLSILRDAVDACVKDLEVYATSVPPPAYALATEVEGIARLTKEAAFERFHLVGYSAGGAASLAFTAVHPERLLSLALMEPAFAGWQAMAPEERAAMEAFRTLLDSDGPDLLARFQRLQLAPGVEPAPPQPGSPPDWMAKRPAGVRAILAAFMTGDLELDRLRSFDRPVWFALGSRSNPDYYARMADRLAGVFADFTVERFPDRHHFDPPHRIEPTRVALSLHALWDRAEAEDGRRLTRVVTNGREDRPRARRP